jgi:hypothetical protein
MTTQVPASMTVEGVTAAQVAAKADDSAVVHLAGTETITGTKTFSNQPVLPQKLTQATAQNSTSGTSIDFTSIPSWVKRITVTLNGVSTNGTSNPRIQLGTGGTPTTTGYSGVTTAQITGTSASTLSAGFDVQSSFAAATNTFTGTAVFVNLTGNTWVCVAGLAVQGGTTARATIEGVIALAGVLNIVRVTTVSGSDTFDAGSINILYE